MSSHAAALPRLRRRRLPKPPWNKIQLALWCLLALFNFAHDATKVSSGHYDWFDVFGVGAQLFFVCLWYLIYKFAWRQWQATRLTWWMLGSCWAIALIYGL